MFLHKEKSDHGWHFHPGAIHSITYFSAFKAEIKGWEIMEFSELHSAEEPEKKTKLSSTLQTTVTLSGTSLHLKAWAPYNYPQLMSIFCTEVTGSHIYLHPHGPRELRCHGVRNLLWITASYAPSCHLIRGGTSAGETINTLMQVTQTQPYIDAVEEPGIHVGSFKAAVIYFSHNRRAAGTPP